MDEKNCQAASDVQRSVFQRGGKCLWLLGGAASAAANNPGVRGRWIWLRAFMAGEFILLWDRADGAKSIPPEIIVQRGALAALRLRLVWLGAQRTELPGLLLINPRSIWRKLNCRQHAPCVCTHTYLCNNCRALLLIIL